MRRRRLLFSLVALFGGVLLAEGALRLLLFSDWALVARLGAGFRSPDHYLPQEALEEYEKLRVMMVPAQERWRAGAPHPELGWVRRNLDPGSLRHPDEAQLRGRRPVLLYGSSFATNDDPANPSYEKLVERTELGEHFFVLNYATFAYGLDQTLLLQEKTLPFYAELDPIVVVAFALEDLSRCAVSFFCAPKPRYELVGDDARLVLPDEVDPDRYLARHPPPVTSYLLQYLVHETSLLPESLRARFALPEVSRDEVQRTTRFLLSRWNADCEARGLAHFLWIFRATWTLPDADRPRDRALLEFLGSARIPHVDSGRDVHAALQEEGLELSALMIGPADRHPNPRGTAALLPGLVRGLEGAYDARE